MSNNDGGPAFPDPLVEAGGTGMSLREYYAAKAMASLIAMFKDYIWMEPPPPGHQDIVLADRVAGLAFLFADAMLEHE